MPNLTMEIIAHIHTPFPAKFGIPRQSGLVPKLSGEIVFTPPYRNAEALRGIEGFSHLWLIWLFSAVQEEGWSPTVRPPRLGGNQRMGVFATRSPFRPNHLGLSSVKLENIRFTPDQGPVLTVSGADLMDGTPILDIKPYLPFTDSHPEAKAGFAEPVKAYALSVEIPQEIRAQIPPSILQPLTQILAQDPRPSYQHDPKRIYGFSFGGLAIRFQVQEGKLLVLSAVPETESNGLFDK